MLDTAKIRWQALFPQLRRPILEIDHSKLTFPSDGLTFAAIRKVHPNSFTQDDPAFFSARRFGDVSALLYMERVLAQLAFAKAAGLPTPYPTHAVDREEIIDDLAEQYQSYGIASGPETARQLIRDLEKAALQQAQAVGR